MVALLQQPSYKGRKREYVKSLTRQLRYRILYGTLVAFFLAFTFAFLTLLVGYREMRDFNWISGPAAIIDEAKSSLSQRTQASASIINSFLQTSVNELELNHETLRRLSLGELPVQTASHSEERTWVGSRVELIQRLHSNGIEDLNSLLSAYGAKTDA